MGMDVAAYAGNSVGLFLLIVVTGAGLPLPEEAPLAMAGVLATREETVSPGAVVWPVMFLTCLFGVIVGDSVPYLVGRRWGTRFLGQKWVRRVVPLATQKRVQRRFSHYGALVLLVVRFVPGTRIPAFLMAGATGVPTYTFLFVNGLAAVPYVGLVFGLAYMFGDRAVAAFEAAGEYRMLAATIVFGLAAWYVLVRLRSEPFLTTDAPGANDELPTETRPSGQNTPSVATPEETFTATRPGGRP